MRFLLGVAALLLFLGGAILLAQAEREHAYTNAPKKFQTMTNPFAGSSPAYASGQRLFEARCTRCHTPDAKGKQRGPSLDTDAIRNAPAGSLQWMIKIGNAAKGMPGFSKLPEEVRWQIVTYLQQWKAGR